MNLAYDKHYQAEKLFGEPYPQLIDFFRNYEVKGKLLDLGCGQGRDSIALARLGFDVTGIDNSKVGINQMNRVGREEMLSLKGVVGDIFLFENFQDFDSILLDSMFHFAKYDKKKEIDFIKRIIIEAKNDCLIVFCIQDTGNKVKILNETIDFGGTLYRMIDTTFDYVFEDYDSNHQSKTKYRMIGVKNSSLENSIEFK